MLELLTITQLVWVVIGCVIFGILGLAYVLWRWVKVTCQDDEDDIWGN